MNYVTEEGIFRERISLDTLLKELDTRIFLPVERGYVGKYAADPQDQR